MCAKKKGRHPLVDEGKSGRTRLLGPVFAVIVQQIPRLGPLKLLGQRITFSRTYWTIALSTGKNKFLAKPTLCPP